MSLKKFYSLILPTLQGVMHFLGYQRQYKRELQICREAKIFIISTFLTTRKATDAIALLCCASGMLIQATSSLSLDYGEFQGSLTHSAYKTH